jgi:hypothetical protein
VARVIDGQGGGIKLTLVESKKKTTKQDVAAAQGMANVYDPNLSEGETARRLLEAHGYHARRQATQNGQWEFLCPFHEEPGQLSRTQSTKFYLAEKTSQYYCQSGHCGEQGNLQTLEKYFGIEADPAVAAKYKSKDTELKEFQANLKTEHRRYLLDSKGLNDDTIERFRIGYDPKRDAYVIPYLETRRPVAFRFYDPTPRGEDEKGRVMYGGPNGSKYWWEKNEDSIIDISDESVLRLFNPGAAGGDPANGQVFVTEGEFKAMLMSQWQFAAVGIPGVNGFKQEWARHFMNAKELIVVMDNDDPEHPANRRDGCRKCEFAGEESCVGHNAGQDGAVKLLDFFGYRGRNVVLPLVEGERKTDINEFVMRDGHGKNDFMRLLLGSDSDSPYAAKSLGDILKNPPPEAVYIVQDILPRGGRLLVTGAPKVGKSIYIENLVLSIAAGIPFLHRFEPANTGLTPGHRVLLLDRELSERSLFDRLNQLISERPGYQMAEDKLLIDHKFRLQIDQPGADEDLISLIKENNAEVVVLDTAYKFFSGGDFEGSRSLAKAFANIDRAIQETGASFILTHHQRKGSNAKGEGPDVDSVAGSFLWTGWANGTVLLNFKNRSVKDPYTTINSFVAFRDNAAPMPLLLKRDRTSISYNEIEEFSFDELEEQEEAGPYHGSGGKRTRPRLTTEALANLLIQEEPVFEEEFLHAAAAHFGSKPDMVKIQLLDVLDTYPEFVRDGKGNRQHPYKLRYQTGPKETTYEEEMGLSGFVDGQVPMTGMEGLA